MKKLLAATLLMAVMAAIGCNDNKKTTKPTTPADKGTEAGKTMPAPEKK
jgi:hypothetical protein